MFTHRDNAQQTSGERKISVLSKPSLSLSLSLGRCTKKKTEYLGERFNAIFVDLSHAIG
jgi:hypothetical protein